MRGVPAIAVARAPDELQPMHRRATAPGAESPQEHDRATDAREATEAAAGGAGKPRYVRRVFSEIAPRYDLLNHVLSMNIDRRWRRRAIARLGWERRPDGIYLDACAGTFDLSLELARKPRFRGRVIGSDFAWPMLAEGRTDADPGRDLRSAP